MGGKPYVADSPMSAIVQTPSGVLCRVWDLGSKLLKGGDLGNYYRGYWGGY